jgi:hypothetical protein
MQSQGSLRSSASYYSQLLQQGIFPAAFKPQLGILASNPLYHMTHLATFQNMLPVHRKALLQSLQGSFLVLIHLFVKSFSVFQNTNQTLFKARDGRLA